VLQRAVGNAALCGVLRAAECERAPAAAPGAGPLVQRAVERARFNVVGEQHDESEKAPRRALEKEMAAQLGLAYWTENAFEVDVGARPVFGASLWHLVLQSAAFIAADLESLARAVTLTRRLVTGEDGAAHVDHRRETLETRLQQLDAEAAQLRIAARRLDPTGEADDLVDAVSEISVYLRAVVPDYRDELEDLADVAADARCGALADLVEALETSVGFWRSQVVAILRSHGYDPEVIGPGEHGLSAEALVEQHIVRERSMHMYLAAESAAAAGRTGMWKVGDEHVSDMTGQPGTSFTLTGRSEFDDVYSAWLAGRDPRGVGTSGHGA
jgi:hypothetical protein